MGGPSGGSGPTLQQQQLQTEQALTTANLNLQENAQRKATLNAMQGTRVFRGSALSRAMRGNAPGDGEGSPPASASQLSNGQMIAPPASSLLDNRAGSGSTPSGGTGGSGGGNGGGIAAIAATGGSPGVGSGRAVLPR